MIAQDVINRVRELINDVATGFVAGTRWSDEELLAWISDGQREIVKLKPEANAVTDIFRVTGGMPRQRLDPTVAYRLIRVEANGSAGDISVTVSLEDYEGTVIYDPYNFGSLISGNITALAPAIAPIVDSLSCSDYYFTLSIISVGGPVPEDAFTSLDVYDDSGSLIVSLDTSDLFSYDAWDIEFEMGGVTYTHYAEWAWSVESRIGDDGDTVTVVFVTG